MPNGVLFSISPLRNSYVLFLTVIFSPQASRNDESPNDQREHAEGEPWREEFGAEGQEAGGHREGVADAPGFGKWALHEAPVERHEHRERRDRGAQNVRRPEERGGRERKDRGCKPQTPAIGQPTAHA
jgi:hypothetical protein